MARPELSRHAAVWLALLLNGCSGPPALAPGAGTIAAATPVAASAATGTQRAAPAAVVAALAPSGRLRAAINFGNPILAMRDPSDRSPRGVSVDLSVELARRLGVPVDWVTYDAAGRVVGGLKDGAWDVGFLAIDPVRAGDISYSPPYVVIEGAYLVAQGSPIRANGDVDQDGIRVVVGSGSAYDLYLSRELRHATLVRAATSQAVTDTMLAQRFEVAAGVKQQLESDAQRVPGVRLLEGRFMVINQAIGIPKGREAGAGFLRDFVEDMKASGFVARALQRHRIEGARVAPADAP